jgi:hypothetical protein
VSAKIDSSLPKCNQQVRSRSIVHVGGELSKTSTKTFDETGSFPYEVIISNLRRNWRSETCEVHCIARQAHKAARVSLGNSLATLLAVDTWSILLR